MSPNAIPYPEFVALRFPHLAPPAPTMPPARLQALAQLGEAKELLKKIERPRPQPVKEYQHG